MWNGTVIPTEWSDSREPHFLVASGEP